MVITVDELPILKDISEELIKQVMVNNKNANQDKLSEISIENMKETVLLMIDSYVKDNLISFRSYKFITQVEEHIFDVVYQDDCLSLLDDEIIFDCIGFYFIIIMNPRHCKSYNEPILNKKYIEERIDVLRNKPQPDQRTAEWYLFRGNHITASSAWKSFESQKTQNQLIFSKCAPIDVKKKSGVNINSACHHGHKYEPLSTMIYEKKNNTIIEEFGCLEDDDTKYLAASPDGINVEKTSPLYGRLLEIKNPKSREISGIPKIEYWVQMQFQMHVTKLHICDFLETTFEEYETEEDFMKDGSFARSTNDKHKGVIICFNDGNGPIYKYSPLDISKEEFDKWYENELEENEHLSWIENVWWKTKVYSCVTVLYNQEWFDAARPYFKKIWSTIEKERISGYQHRKATKRIPKKNIIKIPESMQNVIRVRTQSFDEINGSNNN